MNSIKVLDVTLRDGGCVNDFNFGSSYMRQILHAQEASGVDYIEVGYLDEKKGSLEGRTQYKNVQAVSECLLKDKKPGITYVAMMDYGKFNPSLLPQRTPELIDGIRVAFHKKDKDKIADIGRAILGKGYKLFVQPMITLRYSDAELIELIDTVNRDLSDADAFYIVDSFGEMRPNDMSRILNLVDHNLIPSMTLGFHSHNNLQMSYSNACALLMFPSNRNMMLDSSIMGMGKGAGNLNTELLLEHLNLYYGKRYIIHPLLEVMDKVLNQLHGEYYWGYAPEFYLSAAHHCTPSYASFFYNRHMLPIDQVDELLGLIPEEKKISFDREFAENLYREYNERKTVDDTAVVEELKQIFFGKTVLIIGPGKSIIKFSDRIKEIQTDKDVVTIGLNLTEEAAFDYVVATRSDVLDLAVQAKKRVITTSNVSKGIRGNARILNYGRWIETGDKTHDSSFVITMNLLQTCGIKSCCLAGLDGFSVNINDNYANPELRRPVSEVQAERRNEYYKGFVNRFKESGMSISFVTPSMYE